MKVGFVIGRIGGVDGVALETEKWITILERMGHEVRVLTGELERELPNTSLLPELAFNHPFTVEEQQIAFFGKPAHEKELMERLEAQATRIEQGILRWLERERITLLISENASALPCHLTMGMALRRVFKEQGIPAVTHDHDFHWERGARYATPYKGVQNIIKECFPVKLRHVRHAVINTAARDTLSERFGIQGAVVVPNVMDFQQPYAEQDQYNDRLLADLGLGKDDIPLFQITRIVQRKGIDTAIQLVHKLDNPSVKLVITGTSTDDTEGYTADLYALARKLEIEDQVLFAGERFGAYRGTDGQGRRRYSIEDGYARARACTYFSSYEGFGNAFVEAVIARRPIFVNRYEPVYWPDIGSKGFETVMIEQGELTEKAVDQIRGVLFDPVRTERMVQRNFELGRKHFSYETLEQLFVGHLGL